MNHINWVQQSEDYNTKYHVVKWKTSHFHEPYSKHMVESTKIKQGGAAPMSAAETQAEGEGIGFGLADRSGNARLRLGFGQEDSIARDLSGMEMGRDGVSISAKGMAVQDHMGETVQAAVQSAALAETHAVEHTVTPVLNKSPKMEMRELEQTEQEKTTVAKSSRGNIRNRLQESAARLWEMYQRQKKKAIRLSVRLVRKEEPEKKEKKGTRQAADRETMLAMQAENHYLLDSYDATGNYSVLGKK